MSLRLVRQLLRMPAGIVGGATNKAVLIVLADHCDAEGGSCFPSLDRIAALAGPSRATVVRTLADLECRKLIQRTRSKGRHASEYRLNPTALIELEQSHDETVEPSHPATVEGAEQSHDETVSLSPTVSPCASNCLMVRPDPVIDPKDLKDPPITPQRGGSKTSPIGIKKFLAQCKARGKKPIPTDDPVFEYAKQTKIPNEFLHLCFREFVERNSDNGKRYRDWRQTFRNCVRGNWYRLWYVDGASGQMELTTAGKQAQRKHREAP